ncbi:MAG: type II secretion system F family protein [Chloroflexota bacterium]
MNTLTYGGYQVVSLKLAASRFNKETITGPAKVTQKEVIMFSRQLALLLESGVDIVKSLELLQTQTTKSGFKKILAQIIADIHSGTSLSGALSNHPRVFSKMYHRTIAAGEQGGNLPMVLRRMADYIERSAIAAKKAKGALTYPIVVFGVAAVVVTILVTYVIPTFATLYTSIGAKLHTITTTLLSITSFLTHFGLYLLILAAAAVGAGIAYVRTIAGRSNFDRVLLRLPVVGRIILLNELSRCCRTMSLLIMVGLPVPDVITMAIQSAGNKTVAEALGDVQQELMRGEGISGPMSRKPLFLPMMVAMIAVGEETGNLSKTLTTVADSFETDADDKITAAIALLQPALTIFIAGVVGFIALAMISAMYGIYGQLQ